MRTATLSILIVALLGPCAWAQQKPRGKPSTAPTVKQGKEMEALEKELVQHQSKSAPFAAVKIAKKLYEMQLKISGIDARETQNRGTTLAGLLVQTGDYAGAVNVYRLHVESAERLHGPESREVMYALMSMIGPYWAQNRLDELEPLQVRMLALSKKLDGEDSMMYVGQLQQYGALLNSKNEYSSAVRLYEQALKIQAKIAKDESALVGPIQALASVYWSANQKQKAITLYDRLIKIVDKTATANIQLTAATLWGIASMYEYGGREDLAKPLRKRVIDLYTAEVARIEKANPDDPMLSAMLGQLGFNTRASGDLVNADKLLSRAVAMDDKKNGYSGWAATLAELKRAQNKPKEALALLEKAQAGITKISPQSATVYNTQIADVLRDMGEYKRAEALLAGYMKTIEKQYGKRHPIYGMALLSSSYVYMASNQLPKAEAMLATGLELAERELGIVLKTGTEADHAVYFSRNSYQLDTAINYQVNYAPNSAGAARLGLTTLLRRKGRVLDAAAANLATIRSKLSADDKKVLDDLASARAQLAKLTVAGPSATGDESYAKEVASLEDQIQKLELAIGKKSAAYRAITQPITLASVQKLIPKDAKLVEIVNYQPGDPKAPYTMFPVLKPRRYAAFVVGAKGDPVLIELGEAKAIDDAIEKFRKAIADPANKKVTQLGKALYDLTIAKLVPSLGSTTEILIAPDGALNVIPFSALVDDKQKFLVEKYNFTYLTSGRDLLRLQVKTKAQGGGVMFADPSFDATGPAPANNAPATRGRRSSDLASLEWPPLPGTGKEADEVEKKMKGMKVYRKGEATETTIKQVHGPKVLHLATHGFFLPDEPPPVKKDDARAGAGAPNMPAGNTHENPLLRSGLAFAGANKLASGNDDGILTAMEATGLDLWGTKLVVLSACETGVGKVTNGDGVYGLRRALVIAGAESLVMSLWQVDDEATKELMIGYYTRLGAGKPRSTALRETQLEIAARKGYEHPYFWASFVPAGANEPL